MKLKMFTKDQASIVHSFVYEVWKQSMMLRAYLDIAFALFVVIWFQVGLIDYAYLYKIPLKFGREIICNSPEYSRNYTIQMMRMLKDKLKI